MLYYDPTFTLDTTSHLRVDGFYQIRQIFGTYTTNGKDYHTSEPTYGYLQFFKDGFCKVGWWNGFFQSPSEIKTEIENKAAFGFWGIYKIHGDTLLLEYLYDPSSPGVKPFEHRNTLAGLIHTNEIVVITHAGIKYSFPQIEKDSSTSSCIGKFVKLPTTYNESDNYLKKDIDKYR